MLAGSWCITDASGMLLAVSPGYEALTGFAAAEALGRSSKLLHGPKTEPEVRLAGSWLPG